MMNKIEKLLDLCIAIAEKHLEAPAVTLPAMTDVGVQTMEGAAAEAEDKVKAAIAGATAVPAEALKKTRKPRTAKAPEEANNLEDQLGMAEEPEAPKEMTEEQSRAKMEEVTKQYVSLCKNDTPEDGKTRATALMRNVFKVQKLGELTHQQRIKWIAEMEKGILEHK